jgi:tetratricopeptide (TPR) repeat protein
MSRFCLSLGAAAVSALLCSSALASPPEQSAGTLAQGIDAGVREAQLKRTQKDYAGAVKVLSQLMLVAADDPRVVGEYGKVLVQQGRSAEALDFLRRAVQLQTNDWTLYSALGVVYDQKGDYANAEIAYNRALQLKPGESAILNNFAMSRLQAGDLDRAKQLIAQAANTSKDDRIAKNATMIAGLKAPPAKTAVPASGFAASAPPRSLGRPLTAAEGNTVVMQAVPADPQAGPVGKPKPRKTASSKPAKAKDAIPALRLSGTGQ